MQGYASVCQYDCETDVSEEFLNVYDLTTSYYNLY